MERRAVLNALKSPRSRLAGVLEHGQGSRRHGGTRVGPGGANGRGHDVRDDEEVRGDGREGQAL